jgi:hypothetical protein
MRAHVPIALALLAGVCAVYAPVRQHEFVDYDDAVYLEMLRPGLSWQGIERAFSEPVVANWIPATVVSLLIGQEIHGPGARGHLIANALLHGIAAALLYAALATASGAPWPSAFVAGVFALHPLHVESVAWFSQRKDVLCGLFWMATLLAYLAWVRRGGAARYAAVLLGASLALLSKPTAVTLPFSLLLLDYWPLGRLAPRGRRLPAGGALARAVAEKLPLFALTGLVSVVTYQVQAATGAVASGDLLPLDLRAANAIGALVDYLADAFWPSDLAVFYPHPRELPPLPELAAALVGLVAITAGALQQARTRPQLTVGWLWFLGTLVPVIGLVQVGEQARADRYTYVPLIGLSIAVAFGLADLLGRRLPARPRSGGAHAAEPLAGFRPPVRASAGGHRGQRLRPPRARARPAAPGPAGRGRGRAGRGAAARAGVRAAARAGGDPCRPG